jgi:two-component system sensor histidine kinase PilS (NtrC family)
VREKTTFPRREPVRLSKCASVPVVASICRHPMRVSWPGNAASSVAPIQTTAQIARAEMAAALIDHPSPAVGNDAYAAFESSDSAWRTLTAFAVYRLIAVVLLAMIFWVFRSVPVIGGVSPVIAAAGLGAYLVMSIALILATQLRTPSATIQLSMQVLVDVSMLTLIMHASGGTRSGIGTLLLVSLAAAALVSHGRLAFFHAAVASLAVLFEQLWQFLYGDASAAEFVPSGMLAAGYFVIAGLGYTLAAYARGAAQVAAKRGVDLANLAQINELVIRDMQDGFVVVDERGVIRQHNPQSAEMVSGLRGSSGRALADVAPHLSLLLAEWRADRERIFPIVRDANSQRDYQLRFIAVGDAEVSPTVVFLEDASRIRAQAQQMKLVALGRLTASIAHEIRNPLSSISHAAELLEDDHNRSFEDARLLTIIQENAHRLDRLVEEVLYLNRRDRAHPETIDMSTFLPRFVREFCANEKRPEDAFLINIQSGVSPAFDRAHLDQVLWNLMRNATRFATMQPGSVRLNVYAKGESVVFEITDDGPGVATEALPHLFEPFFTTDSKGTGLGLYIARELADVNGATLDCVIEVGTGNRGAKFRLSMNGAKAL